MDKHSKIRVESWCKKFCQITNNVEWKKNRNLHTISLLDMILNEHYEEPYTKFPPEGPLPILPKFLVKSRLSQKFLDFSESITNQEKQNAENEKTSNQNNKKKYNNKNNFKNLINKCNNPELLKKIIEKLEDKINKAEEIIIEQDEERNQLLEKIQNLENSLRPYLNKV